DDVCDPLGVCAGERPLCPDYCNGNGRCCNGVCTCRPGWSGESCAVLSLDGVQIVAGAPPSKTLAGWLIAVIVLLVLVVLLAIALCVFFVRRSMHSSDAGFFGVSTAKTVASGGGGGGGGGGAVNPLTDTRKRNRSRTG